jgi:hypothetical protein
MSNENCAGTFWLEGSVYRIIGQIWCGLCCFAPLSQASTLTFVRLSKTDVGQVDLVLRLSDGTTGTCGQDPMLPPPFFPPFFLDVASPPPSPHFLENYFAEVKNKKLKTNTNHF